MQQSLTTPTVPAVQMPVMLVAEVQDSLLVVVHDLTRLDGLLAHTMENLMERFTSASANLATPALMSFPGRITGEKWIISSCWEVTSKRF
jgi:hypothetical protein